jgi:hypothetical protein
MDGESKAARADRPSRASCGRSSQPERSSFPFPEPAARQRWSRLAQWGRRDLGLARVAEGHAGAVAILAEAGTTGALVPSTARGPPGSAGTGAGLIASGDELR